jgi:hypothetical protein
MALLKNTAELKKFVRVAGTITENTLMNSVSDAQDKYLRDVLGKTLLTNLDEWYNSEDPDDVAEYTALLPYVQRALARFTLFIASPEIDVTITESGIGVISNNSIAPASSDRVKKLDESNEKRGFDNLESLIRFLEANKDDYGDWTESEAYTLSIRNLINSAVEFDKIINIDKSRLYFSKIRNIIDDVDLLYIKPAISSELFDAIIAEIAAGEISEENALILPYLRRAEAYYTVSDSLDRSKYDGVGVQINQIFLERDMELYKTKAETFLNEARKILDKNPDDYPEYQSSDVYLGLDANGNTQYSGFDNTKDDNHIFVM